MNMADITEAYTARKEVLRCEGVLKTVINRGSSVYGLSDTNIPAKRKAIAEHLDRIEELQKKIDEKQAIVDRVRLWAMTRNDSDIMNIVERRVQRLEEWTQISREVLGSEVGNTSQVRLRRFMADENPGTE